ncbi:MAG TPA: glutamate synthase-related protein [Atribacteraceae bacterium]|nr:glutamate synthase-related protein [Atribacteraceae bacterium]
MAISLLFPEYKVKRDDDRCISCQVCVRQCANDVHQGSNVEEQVQSEEEKCVGCQRCVTLCPTAALSVEQREAGFCGNASWSRQHLRNLYKQSETGGILLTGMGCDRPYPIYWDHLLLNASQVTNPSIDPLREPIELRTFLGRKEEKAAIDWEEEGLHTVTTLTPQLELEIPVLFSAMSYGSISFNAFRSLAEAARQTGTYCNSGEGGLHPELYPYGNNIIVQVASGRYGVHPDYLRLAAAVEIKIGQGAKPGIGGHLPGEKVSVDISRTRKIPVGSDAISPAPHHDIYSIEDLARLIYAIKETVNYQKPVSVKIAAVHNVAAIASGVVRAGADIVAIDGIRGGTGAAPRVIRDNVGIPIELALAQVDEKLRREGIRHQASLLIAGGIRASSDVLKAVALGADAVYIGTAALVGLGCHLCQKCYTGKCNWGIATQDPLLTKRLNPNIGVRRLVNLLRAWSFEIKEMLGGMGMNAIESLRGNREQLRSIGLSREETMLLGVKQAGEGW